MMAENTFEVSPGLYFEVDYYKDFVTDVDSDFAKLSDTPVFYKMSDDPVFVRQR